jgi:hypothetical protein
MVRDGVTLRTNLPVGVSSSVEMWPYTLSAAQWWNQQVREVVFDFPTSTPDVMVYSGYVPAGDFDVETATGGAAGFADIQYSLWDGLITSCEITVSSDISDAHSVVEVTKHELGHCLGLDDDPDSLDLNSIMSSPMPWRGELTEGDLALVRGML